MHDIKTNHTPLQIVGRIQSQHHWPLAETTNYFAKESTNSFAKKTDVSYGFVRAHCMCDGHIQLSVGAFHVVLPGYHHICHSQILQTIKEVQSRGSPWSLETITTAIPITTAILPPLPDYHHNCA